MRYDAVPLEKLEFDLNNPRFEPCSNQLEALALLCTDSGKISTLMRHIAENGLNPTERVIVVASEKRGKFVVLEGNRRLAALKLLSKPEMIDAIDISSAAGKALRKAASTDFTPSEIEKIESVVFDDKGEASIWIDLKHTGENGGAGVVGWDGIQTARYRQSDATLAVIEFAIEAGLLPKDDATTKSFPITNLQRLLGDPYVRGALGINISRGEVTSDLSRAETEKGLRRVLNDLASGKITVTDIKRKSDRAAYVDKLPKRELPNLSAKVAEWSLTKSQSANATTNGASKATANTQRSSKDRLYLIPRELKLEINDHRLNKIYWELKRDLKLGVVANATAVLFRTFVELTLDLYLETNGLPTTRKGYDLKLDDKINSAITRLESQGVLTAKGSRLARMAMNQDSVSNPLTFHAFVHDRTAQPTSVALIAMWTHVEPLLVAIYKAMK
ncbi:hypothetical protein [Burkholderia gladioli]|uniref:hypothetical protein n=1 Tax=Burkholderia gladioli TaxID=28095 RepID=UPI001640ABB0|nr:hypothetical protein [Burkholderia gladioli]